MYFYQFDLPINKNAKTLTLLAVLPTQQAKITKLTLQVEDIKWPANVMV